MQKTNIKQTPFYMFFGFVCLHKTMNLKGIASNKQLGKKIIKPTQLQSKEKKYYTLGYKGIDSWHYYFI